MTLEYEVISSGIPQKELEGRIKRFSDSVEFQPTQTKMYVYSHGNLTWFCPVQGQSINDVKLSTQANKYSARIVGVKMGPDDRFEKVDLRIGTEEYRLFCKNPEDEQKQY